MRSGKTRPRIFGLLCIADETGDGIEELACRVELCRHLSTSCRHFARKSCIYIKAGSVPIHFVGKSRDFRCKSFFFRKGYVQPIVFGFLRRWRDFNSHLAGESAKSVAGCLALVHARTLNGFLECGEGVWGKINPTLLSAKTVPGLGGRWAGHSISATASISATTLARTGAADPRK